MYRYREIYISKYVPQYVLIGTQNTYVLIGTQKYVQKYARIPPVRIRTNLFRIRTEYVNGKRLMETSRIQHYFFRASGTGIARLCFSQPGETTQFAPSIGPFAACTQKQSSPPPTPHPTPPFPVPAAISASINRVE